MLIAQYPHDTIILILFINCFGESQICIISTSKQIWSFYSMCNKFENTPDSDYSYQSHLSSMITYQKDNRGRHSQIGSSCLTPEQVARLYYLLSLLHCVYHRAHCVVVFSYSNTYQYLAKHKMDPSTQPKENPPPYSEVPGIFPYSVI